MSNFERFEVTVQYNTGLQGTFGDFASREAAEACLLALAGRRDVRLATIRSV
jgi:hypothetical protein